jgi:hypothetical protein
MVRIPESGDGSVESDYWNQKDKETYDRYAKEAEGLRETLGDAEFTKAVTAIRGSSIRGGSLADEFRRKPSR